MAIAPSEKHLEDWIVANYATWFGQQTEYTVGSFSKYTRSLIGRQLRTPYGIIDLVGHNDRSVFPIELKKGVLDSVALAQTLRYMCYIADVWIDVNVEMFYANQGPEWRPEFGDMDSLYCPSYHQLVAGMIVAHSINDENLLYACHASHIKVVTYEHHPNQFPEYIFTNINTDIGNMDVEGLRFTPIGQILRQIMVAEIELGRGRKVTS